MVAPIRAETEPELIKRWWAGDRGEVTGVEVDLRVGGRWRYTMVVRCGTDFDGTEVTFHGEYRDAHINSGMESGLQEALDHLERTAASLI